MTLRSCVTSLALAAGLAGAADAGDWPQFRGPNRDGVSPDKGLLQTWPKGGPKLLWTAQGLGSGYSSMSLAGDRLYTLGNRDGTTYVVALERDTGREVWASPVGRAGNDTGCTPTVDGGQVFALGQHGDLVALDAQDGKRLWHKNLPKDFGGVVGGWKYCESPLVDGNKVVVTPGGKEATLVALDRNTGEPIWKCPIPIQSTDAGYASIVVARTGNVRQYVQLLNGGVAGVSDDGRFLWKYERLGPNTANIPNPVVVDGNHVFAAAGYDKGGALLRLRTDGKNVRAEELWYNPQLKNKHGGVVLVGGRLYGDADDSGHPWCADAKTGKRLWQRDRQGQGSGSASITYADGRLYVHYTNGVVALVGTSPRGYEELGSFQVPERDGNAWAHPVICDGRLYLREGSRIFCYNVKK